MLPDGTTELLGRSDTVINAGGVKVLPELIEGYCLESLEIEAATFLSSDSLGIPKVGLAFVASAGFDPNSLRQALENQFGASAPVHYFWVDSIPRSERGKPMRKQLAAMFSQEVSDSI